LRDPRGPLELFLAIAVLHHFHEVPDFVNHAANRRRVLALDDMMQAAQAEAANGFPHVIGAADRADHPLDLDRSAGLFAVVLGPVEGLLCFFYVDYFSACH
jgi:hypothetical protein